MHLNKEEVATWRLDPVTSEILRRLRQERWESLENMASGTTLGTTAAETTQHTADAVGYIRGLDYVLEFQGDPEPEKEQQDDE